MNRTLLFVFALAVALTSLGGCGMYNVQCYRTGATSHVIEFYPTKTTLYVKDGAWRTLKATEDSTNAWTTQPVTTWAKGLAFAINPSYPYGTKVAEAVWSLDGGGWHRIHMRSQSDRLAYGFSIPNTQDGYHCLEVRFSFEDACNGDDPEDWIVHTVQVPLKFSANRKTALWDKDTSANVVTVRSKERSNF